MKINYIRSVLILAEKELKKQQVAARAGRHPSFSTWVLKRAREGAEFQPHTAQAWATGLGVPLAEIIEEDKA